MRYLKYLSLSLFLSLFDRNFDALSLSLFPFQNTRLF